MHSTLKCKNHQLVTFWRAQPAMTANRNSDVLLAIKHIAHGYRIGRGRQAVFPDLLAGTRLVRSEIEINTGTNKNQSAGRGHWPTKIGYAPFEIWHNCGCNVFDSSKRFIPKYLAAVQVNRRYLAPGRSSAG